jgi:hypothetical protein
MIFCIFIFPSLNYNLQRIKYTELNFFVCLYMYDIHSLEGKRMSYHVIERL